MKPNLVSVVIPVYNEEQAIGDDLDLIIKTMEASDYDYEIIVVDDGSTDSSADIVRQRSQVRLIRHPYNRGTGATRTIVIPTGKLSSAPGQSLGDAPTLVSSTDRPPG